MLSAAFIDKLGNVVRVGSGNHHDRLTDLDDGWADALGAAGLYSRVQYATCQSVATGGAAGGVLWFVNRQHDWRCVESNCVGAGGSARGRCWAFGK